MLDIHTLEKRWMRYKLKRFLPSIAIAVSLMAGFSTGIYFWPSSKEKKPVPTIQVVEKPSAKISVKPPDENVSVILEPSMKFIQEITIPEPVLQTAPASKPLPQEKAQPYSTVNTPPKEVVIPFEIPPASVSKKIPAKNSSPLISKTESNLDIEGLEARFKQNPNSGLGLFIARYHYDHGNYAQSYNYALKTNSINDKIDESWIIFSKSLVKLDRIDQAKKTLKIYIEQSNSDSAKGLLDSIEKGSFK